MHFTGLLLGICTFLIIGIFHPVVVKCYYWFGTRCWWWFLVLGLAAMAGSLFVESVFPQTVLGVLAFSSFWTIKEIFEQRERVLKGWFPANPAKPDQSPHQPLSQPSDRSSKQPSDQTSGPISSPNNAART